MKLDPPAILADLPIPEDVRPTRLWPEQLLELAAHVGPYDALRVAAAVGGQRFKVPMDWEKNRLRTVVGDDAARIISQIYGGPDKWQVPRAPAALAEARRGPVLAAVRSGALTIGEAAAILQATERHISRLINQSDEGKADRAWVPPRIRPRRIDPRQLDMFPG